LEEGALCAGSVKTKSGGTRAIAKRRRRQLKPDKHEDNGAVPMPPRISERARTLLREQLEHGPKPESQIEAVARAAAIPDQTLIRATDALGVRTQRGRWWLPG
jgi:hypothetical protein